MSAISSAKSRTLIIGIGNEYRSDDGAGLFTVRRLQQILTEPVEIIEQTGEGTALIEAWKNFQLVILIDAVHSGAKPGTIFRFAAHQQLIPTKFFHYSSHAFGVAEAVALAQTMKQLPLHLLIYGIEGSNFAAGIGLSSDVDKAIPDVVQNIIGEVTKPKFSVSKNIHQ